MRCHSIAQLYSSRLTPDHPCLGVGGKTLNYSNNPKNMCQSAFANVYSLKRNNYGTKYGRLCSGCVKIG